MEIPEENTEQIKPEDDFPVAEQPDEPTAAEPERKIPVGSGSRWQRFKKWYKADKKKSIPLTVLALVILIILVPWSRYHSIGLVLKKNFTVQVLDSTADIPVSGADVKTGSASGVTDGNGKVTLHGVKVGSHKFEISKKYYQDRSASLLVPILGQKNTPGVSLVATGRQVKIVVTNLIDHHKVSGVDIEVADVKAKTDKNGSALIVLPVGTKSQKAKLSLAGYNDAEREIMVSSRVIKENDLKMTPAGKIYFLSKLSGKIDIIKTNLDGSDRQTVLAGTGKEEDRGTILLASRDWKFLALLSNRDGKLPQLYVMNTDDDKLLSMDQGNASFTPVGWYDHRFVYTVSRNGFNSWQPNAVSIKSYNAETGQMLPLVNSNATGSSNADAEYEVIDNAQFVGDEVIYTRTWYRYPGYLQVAGKQDVLAAIHSDGTNSHQLKSVDANTSYISNLKLNKPRQLYFGVYSDGTSATEYFVLDKGSVGQASGISDKDLTGEANTYLLSPSDNQTFWQEERDGKNILFIGNEDAANAKQIAVLSPYNIYGWFSDNYLLVSKNSSELYILSKNGIKNDSEAIKISDYHKPAQNFYGYGGGYGGL